MRGRPSKFSPDRVAAVLALIRVGHYLCVAAGAAGVGRSTVKRWLQQGRQSGRKFAPYREFRDAYMKARAQARKGMEACALKAATEDPNLSLKVLERLYPGDWGTHKNEIRRMGKEVAEIKGVLEGMKNGKTRLPGSCLSEAGEATRDVICD